MDNKELTASALEVEEAYLNEYDLVPGSDTTMHCALALIEQYGLHYDTVLTGRTAIEISKLVLDTAKKVESNAAKA